MRVVRSRPNLIIVQHRLGFIMANAGVDQSNVRRRTACIVCCCCRSIRTPRPRRCGAKLQQRYGVDIGVIISDSFGRAWRRGTCGIAIGAAGLPSLIDLRGQPDLFGRTLEVSIIGFADEIAAAASLLQGPGGRGAARGAGARAELDGARSTPAAELVRPPEEDLFR